MNVVTGANIHFGMQSIQLKPHMWSMGKEHIELSPQLMLIHLTSKVSPSSNELDEVGREFPYESLQHCCLNFFCDFPEHDVHHVYNNV